MGKHKHIKPEAVHVRGVCVVCGERKQHKRGPNAYRALCRPCHMNRHEIKLVPSLRPWIRHRKDFCERCGPAIKYHRCQLDVDHIDGDRSNNDPSNYQTLCANCHRLKTFENEDWR